MFHQLVKISTLFQLLISDSVAGTHILLRRVPVLAYFYWIGSQTGQGALQG